MKPLPKFLRKYFWDTDFRELGKENYKLFIIERILEYGDEKAIKWLRNNFSLKEIKNAFCRSKNLSRRSANFWQIIFNLKRNNILCLRKSFPEKQKLIWKH
ncbi:MAG: hypothetical protein ABIG08_02960 [bacterium]